LVVWGRKTFFFGAKLLFWWKKAWGNCHAWVCMVGEGIRSVGWEATTSWWVVENGEVVPKYCRREEVSNE
jgi:hypothetical protein